LKVWIFEDLTFIAREQRWF